MKNIVVLGSTGSIGTQTLDVVRALPDDFRVAGLSAGRNLGLLAEQVAEFKPRMVWCEEGRDSVGGDGASLVPPEEMVTEPDVDLVMVATTGRAGLVPTLNALRAGKAVALSNKEVVVMAGELVTRAAAKHGAPLLPVDSEPSAIWQCMRGEDEPVRRLIITASGGPFRTRPLDEIAGVTPTEALAHPTWVMGRKITIDSSTLMNKGFEVIESRWLFDIPFDRIDVVVHPQSVIHSMIECADGSVKAQMGPPDMRLPIQAALAYPARLDNGKLPRYDPLAWPSLTFEPLDPARYPCFATAVAAGRKEQTYPAVLSAADEEAVHYFLDGRIGFGDIHRIVQSVLDRHESFDASTPEAVLEADAWARREAAAAAGVG
ncbi:MAG: 1-deoxy-D-xylulose-5-phosphate reductoisomerase [Chloroflexi bacterium]|nr:1-deoxy-D-xylulose-5-phosphate reductoisomerase [Chloroflexota bacterium]